MVKFTKSLASWKVKLRKMDDRDASYAEVHKIWPRIPEDHWETFKNTPKLPATVALRSWGKDLQKKNITVPKLGSRGYAGKEPVWAKEDAFWAKNGITNIFDQFKDPLARKFIRARYWPEKQTGVLITDDTTKKVEAELVINLPASNQVDNILVATFLTLWFTFLLQKRQRDLMESESSSSRTSRTPWDTPLNRALNMLLEKPLDHPSAHGRIIGGGDGCRWDYYYLEPTESRKTRKHINFDAKFSQFQERTLAVVREEFQAQFHSLVPILLKHLKENPDEPFPVPSFGGSNSNNLPKRNPPDVQMPPATAPQSSPSSVSGMPDAGQSTLDELNALKVIKRRMVRKCILPFLWL